MPLTRQKAIAPKEQKKIPAEVVHPETRKAPQETDNPKRHASGSLVDRGITAFKANNSAVAEQLFQDAINVDPANGIAYYYLARIALQRGQSDAALGFLDKADALLGGDPYWKDQIVELQFEINGNAPEGQETY